jgi:hypothetical protein
MYRSCLERSSPERRHLAAGRLTVVTHRARILALLLAQLPPAGVLVRLGRIRSSMSCSQNLNQSRLRFMMLRRCAGCRLMWVSSSRRRHYMAAAHRAGADQFEQGVCLARRQVSLAPAPRWGRRARMHRCDSRTRAPRRRAWVATPDGRSLHTTGRSAFGSARRQRRPEEAAANVERFPAPKEDQPPRSFVSIRLAKQWRYRIESWRGSNRTEIPFHRVFNDLHSHSERLASPRGFEPRLLP